MLRRLISFSLFFFGCAVLSFCPVLSAQQDCNVEVKVLLSPTDGDAVAALGAKNQSSGHVYFFDTDGDDLLSQGVILRLRQGRRRDLTVKLRSLDGKTSSLLAEGSECEVDQTGEGDNYSYSLSIPLGKGALPESGYEISRLLNPAQMKMLKSVHVSLDWSRVKRVADITSTAWQIRGQPPFEKLALELWAWPGGKVLELSTRVRRDSASETYSELRQLVKMKQLSISPDQGLKTTIALKAITHSAPRQ